MIDKIISEKHIRDGKTIDRRFLEDIPRDLLLMIDRQPNDIFEHLYLGKKDYDQHFKKLSLYNRFLAGPCCGMLFLFALLNVLLMFDMKQPAEFILAIIGTFSGLYASKLIHDKHIANIEEHNDDIETTSARAELLLAKLAMDSEKRKRTVVGDYEINTYDLTYVDCSSLVFRHLDKCLDYVSDFVNAETNILNTMGYER